MSVGRRLVGGLLAGLGKGIVESAVQDGKLARERALEEIRDAREQRRETRRLENQRQIATERATIQRETEAERSRRALELEDLRAAKREDLERLRASLRPDRAGGGRETARFETVTDEDGTPLYQVNTQTGERKAVPRTPREATPASPRDARDTAIMLKNALLIATDDVGQVDYERAARYLEQRGYTAEANELRNRGPAASEGAEQNRPGLFQRAADMMRRERDEPSAPAPRVVDQPLGFERGVPMPDDGLPTPQTADEYAALPSGTRFRAPDGTVRVKP